MSVCQSVMLGLSDFCYLSFNIKIIALKDNIMQDNLTGECFDSSKICSSGNDDRVGDTTSRVFSYLF